ncbi:MAG: ArsA family ATPase [Deltaproteobacteria bacterium]|nr:ArsA family ATPase [Deltaproteobacteria bacterium]
MTRLLVCAGLGGVGKTTTSAALALRCAQEGDRVVVLTIDPARRLADALGVERLGNEPVPVPLDAPGTLHALMLDRKATWDEVIRRYAPSDEIRDRLLGNRYYEQVSTRLGGSQEYMANEKLYQLVQSGAWDVVVLDTPPARQTVEFFRAPERMRGVFDQRVLEGLLRPSKGLLAMAGRRVTGLLRRIAGDHVLGDIAEFFSLTTGLSAGFRERHRAVHEWLHDRERTGYYLVTAARNTQSHDVREFLGVLEGRQMRLAGFFVNRTTRDPGLVEPIAELQPPAGVEGVVWGRALDGLVASAAAQRREARREGEEAAALVRSHGQVPVWMIPDLGEEVRDLRGLTLLARFLPPSPATVIA